MNGPRDVTQLNLRLDAELVERFDRYVAEVDATLPARRYTKTEAVEAALAAFLDSPDGGPIESRLAAVERRIDALEGIPTIPRAPDAAPEPSTA